MVSEYTTNVLDLVFRTKTLQEAVEELVSHIHGAALAQALHSWSLDLGAASQNATATRERAIAALCSWQVLDALDAGTAPAGYVIFRDITEAEAHQLRERFLSIGWAAEEPEPTVNGARVPESQDAGSSEPSGFSLRALKPSDSAHFGKVFQLQDATVATEYIDDEELISSTELSRAQNSEQANGKTSGCGTSGVALANRQPCANCTCGRRDQQDAAVNGGSFSENTAKSDPAGKTPTMETGSCNSCHLGDAFRCASCPYLGLPPFKPGAPLKIDAKLLEGDL